MAALHVGTPERFLACFTPEAELEGPERPPLRGAAGLESWLRSVRKAFPLAACEPLRIVLCEDSGAVEWHARLRDAAGREHSLTGVAMLDFERDRISRVSLYYHAPGAVTWLTRDPSARPA